MTEETPPPPPPLSLRLPSTSNTPCFPSIPVSVSTRSLKQLSSTTNINPRTISDVSTASSLDQRSIKVVLSSSSLPTSLTPLNLPPPLPNHPPPAPPNVWAAPFSPLPSPPTAPLKQLNLSPDSPLPGEIQMFGVRVFMPHCPPSVIICDHKTTVLQFVEKSLLKLKAIQGTVYSVNDIQVRIEVGTDHEQVLNEWHRPIYSLFYVCQRLAESEQPEFTICHIKEDLKGLPPQDALPLPPPPPDSLEPRPHSFVRSMTSLMGRNQVAIAAAAIAKSKSDQKSRRESRRSFDAGLLSPLPSAPLTAVMPRSQSEAVINHYQQSDLNTSDDLAGEDCVVTIADIKSSVTHATRSEKDSRSEGSRVRPTSLYNVIHAKSVLYEMDVCFQDQAEIIRLTVDGDLSIADIKENVWNHPEFPAPNEDMDKYMLRFYMPSTDEPVDLFDEDQVFRTVSVVQQVEEHLSLFFSVVPKQKNQNKALQLVNKKIGNLIGFGLYRLDYIKNFEVDVFRRQMIAVRRDATKDRDNFQFNFQPNIDKEPARSSLLAKLYGTGRITVRLHFPSVNVVKTVAVKATDSAAEFLSTLLEKYQIYVSKNADLKTYCLKVCGAHDFIHGSDQMINFTYIRQCLAKDQKINLTLFSTINTEIYTNELYEDFNLIEDPCVNLGTHAQLTIEGQEEDQIRTISLWDLARNFRAQIVACENLKIGAIESVYVEVGVYFGGEPLCPVLRTHQVPASRDPRWGTLLNFDIPCYNLPRAARLCLTVWGRWNARKKIDQDRESDIYPLGWVNMLLMDFKGFLRTGLIKLALWPNDKANPIGTTTHMAETGDQAFVFLKLETYAHPVIFPTESFSNDYRDRQQSIASISSEHADRIRYLIASDPLTKLSDGDKEIIWKYRHHLASEPTSLPKLLLSTRWNVLDHVIEIRKLMNIWGPLPADAALELLDANYGDATVRAFAVKHLESLSDSELLDFLLQLVQALKYEPYLDNALSRFLLKRALRSKVVGHYFFWYLRSEMDDPSISLRFAVMLEAYLRGAGSYMDNLIRQNEVMFKLTDIAQQLKKAKTPQERKETLTKELESGGFPSHFTIPLDPKYEATDFVVSKCKVMDSKKLPLWCVMQNQDTTGNNIYVIFKSGDDLRQDMLTMQMIRIMDRLWQAEDLDLRMSPYGCLATGTGIGMIEIVLNSETVSSIQMANGGTRAAFKDQPLEEWLRKQNPDNRDYDKAVETFALSCAGYCVATYVLGIGDRHNDNIMLSRSGHLFHIDFGHFLGNIKKKFGIKRERAPFVLTPDFVYVMGKKEGMESVQFQKFIDYCVRAYLILRKKANMFINLFAMMLSTGIPELKSAEDIYYLRDALCLGKTDEDAAQEFKNLIFESLKMGWSTQLNWAIHNFVHSK